MKDEKNYLHAAASFESDKSLKSEIPTGPLQGSHRGENLIGPAFSNFQNKLKLTPCPRESWAETSALAVCKTQRRNVSFVGPTRELVPGFLNFQSFGDFGRVIVQVGGVCTGGVAICTMGVWPARGVA